MRISEAFSGNYLKATDLSTPRVMSMVTVTVETIGEEKSSKPVLRFHGEQRGLVLNKVNSIEIAGWYGDDTAAWVGQPVELYSTTTFFSGRQVPCIRVRRPAMQQPMQYPAPAPVQPYMPAQQPMQAPQPQQAAAPLQAPNVPFDA
jgi:hypothetical protein